MAKIVRSSKEILGSNFLNEDYEYYSPKEGNMKEFLEAVTQRTVLEKIEDPSELEIFSLFKSRSGDSDFHVLHILPQYVGLNLFMPQSMDQVYFQKKNKNVGVVPVTAFKNAGMTSEQIREVSQIGYYMQFPNEHNMYKTLIPSKAFLATLCKRLRIGKLDDGVDPLRDIYIASKLNHEEGFSILYRMGDQFGKAFACFSLKAEKYPQTVAVDFKESLKKHCNVSIKQWKYTHFVTEVDFVFPELTIMAANTKIAFGVRLSFSEVGDASFKLQNVIYVNGGVVLLSYFVSVKRNGFTSADDMVNSYTEKGLDHLKKVADKMKEWEEVKVKSKKETVAAVLNKIDINTAIGAVFAKAFFDVYLEKCEGPGTLMEAMLSVLKIPGALKQRKKYAIERGAICVGSIFDLNIDKIAC